MLSSQHLICSCLAFLFLVQKGHSLRCYSCPRGGQDCSPGAALSQSTCTASNFCLKVVAEDQVLAQKCYDSSDYDRFGQFSHEGCKSTAGGQFVGESGGQFVTSGGQFVTSGGQFVTSGGQSGGTRTVCLCRSDLCNGGGQTGRQGGGLVLMVLLSCVTAFYAFL
eukprot:GFUD01014207.1.p1 GENE.GFUD01014207.1~~GFUD01014207.1.p1  ORF type:complete len:165 (+),score=40.00 GFUD01014207.1:103-597(+)